MIKLWLSCFLLSLIVREGWSLRKFYMEDDCSGTIDMETSAIPAGRLSVTRRSNYRSALSCSVTIKAPLDRQIVVVFRAMDIEWEQHCDDDYVSFHDGPDTMAPHVKGTPMRMCGYTVPRSSYASTNNVITVFFQSDIFKQSNGFEIVFTAFHSSPSCFVDELRCDNGRCISSLLRCNNYNNCGDKSDECNMSSEVIVAVVLSVFLLTVVAVGIVIIFRRRNEKKAFRKANDLRRAIQKVTGRKRAGTSDSVEIHPCESCSFKIVKSQREKRKRHLEYENACVSREISGESRDDGIQGAENGMEIFSIHSHLDFANKKQSSLHRKSV